MLDLARLETLRRFRVCGTITATAESMGYSPSAVSQQLAALEAEMGVALLERTARSASLTPAGELLTARAYELLDLAESVESEIAAQAGTVRGRLTISTIPNLAAPVAVALAHLQTRHPQLDVMLRESSTERAAADVVDHLSDLAIVDAWTPRPPRPAEGLTRYRLLTEPVGLAVPAATELASNDRPLSKHILTQVISTRTWLCAPIGHGSRIAGDSMLNQLGISPSRRWEFEGLITVAELVANSAGYAFLPTMVANTQHDRLVLLTLPTKMVRHVHALTRTSATRQPAITSAITAIKQQIHGSVGATK